MAGVRREPGATHERSKHEEGSSLRLVQVCSAFEPTVMERPPRFRGVVARLPRLIILGARKSNVSMMVGHHAEGADEPREKVTVL